MERLVVKLVLHLLGVSASFPTYLVTQLTEYGFEKVIIPLLNWAVNSGILYYDTEKGKIQVKKLGEAREGGSNEDYDIVVDDILRR